MIRWFLILLCVVAVGLAAVLAREGQWVIAVPDGLFAAALGLFTFESLREENGT